MTFPEVTKEEKRSIRLIRNRLVKGKDEKPVNTITNFVTVLENDPRLEGAIRLNEMNGRVHIVKPLGWKREKNGAITDTDINYIRLLIEQSYGLVGEKPAVSAIDIVANEHRYHPILELIRSFDWDGKERIRYVLHHFLGAEVNEFNYQCMLLFLLGGLSRIHYPGCKFDYMLCLIGDQGAGKSTFFRKLALRDEWFTDDIKRLDDENVYRRLEGHFIIEMPEMSAIANTRTIEETKAFISRSKDTYKVPYDRLPKDRPRQCIFGGSGNRVAFLPLDRTGNRRFLPILIDMSKAEVHILEDERESERYIEQVWAEALMIYAMGEPELKLPDEEEKELTRIQRYFMPEDDRLGMIIGYLDKTSETSVCSRMLYRYAFGIEGEPRNKDLLEVNDVMNAGIASKEIVGWKRYEGAKYFSDYGKQRGWERVTTGEPEFTEIQCELPEGLFDDKPSSQ
ncbi:MAG: virulence-associated protein E [Clostridia bacterium]|nr:virulence-associated protein E [Clostridia bacterium]